MFVCVLCIIDCCWETSLHLILLSRTVKFNWLFTSDTDKGWLRKTVSDQLPFAIVIGMILLFAVVLLITHSCNPNIRLYFKECRRTPTAGQMSPLILNSLRSFAAQFAGTFSALPHSHILHKHALNIFFRRPYQCFRRTRVQCMRNSYIWVCINFSIQLIIARVLRLTVCSDLIDVVPASKTVFSLFPLRQQMDWFTSLMPLKAVLTNVIIKKKH